MHVLIHALAKANLFMIVGSLLHRRFSQQDTRFLSSDNLTLFLLISLSVRLSSLVGLSFTAGFFSKEQILLGHYFLIRRRVSYMLLLSISRLTIAYCLKLFLTFSKINSQRIFQIPRVRFSQIFPVLLIRFSSVTFGISFSFNFSLSNLLLERMVGSY
jgi:NADH:ubiquinone oxidoreductase subunit 5 (subunit L)/multisubunit Na+/H+ antiporter MnhA subunit